MGAGVIIAGGRSTRFGDQDKAVADLAGTPMIRRVADRISGAVDSLVINCRSDQTDAIRAAMADYDHEVVYAEDREPDLGPVAGIATGLRAARTAADATEAAVVACDMPFVDPDLLAYLFERVEGHDAAVPRVDGWYQTTQAVYRVEPTIEACEAALQRGDRKVMAPLETLDVAVVEEPTIREYADLETFENVNTREELRAAAGRL